MAVRDRMTPSHQSVEHVRRVVREAQHKVVGGPAPPISDFNEEADDCYMADEHEISVRNPLGARDICAQPPLILAPGQCDSPFQLQQVRKASLTATVVV
jgi:hypothetical protein